MDPNSATTASAILLIHVWGVAALAMFGVPPLPAVVLGLPLSFGALHIAGRIYQREQREKMRALREKMRAQLREKMRAHELGERFPAATPPKTSAAEPLDIDGIGARVRAVRDALRNAALECEPGPPQDPPPDRPRSSSTTAVPDWYLDDQALALDDVLTHLYDGARLDGLRMPHRHVKGGLPARRR